MRVKELLATLNSNIPIKPKFIASIEEKFTKINKRIGNPYDWRQYITELDLQGCNSSELIAIYVYLKNYINKSLFPSNDYWAQKAIQRIIFEVRDTIYQRMWHEEQQLEAILPHVENCDSDLWNATVADLEMNMLGKKWFIDLSGYRDQEELNESEQEQNHINYLEGDLIAENDSESINALYIFIFNEENRGSYAITPLYNMFIIDHVHELKLMGVVTHKSGDVLYDSSIYYRENPDGLTFYVKASQQKNDLYDIGEWSNAKESICHSSLSDRICHFVSAATAFAATFQGSDQIAPFNTIYTDLVSDQGKQQLESHYNPLRQQAGMEVLSWIALSPESKTLEGRSLEEDDSWNLYDSSENNSNGVQEDVNQYEEELDDEEDKLLSDEYAALQDDRAVKLLREEYSEILDDEVTNNIHVYWKCKGTTRHVIRTGKMLGEGFHGQVFEHIEDNVVNEDMVIKKSQEDLVKEFAIGYKLSHPSICKSYKLYIKKYYDGTSLYKLVMEKVRGEKLSQTSQFTKEMAINYLTQVRCITKFINKDNNAIQCSDLSFDNIFVDDSNQLKLLDLGEWNVNKNAKERTIGNIKAVSFFIFQLTLKTALESDVNPADFPCPDTLFGNNKNLESLKKKTVDTMNNQVEDRTSVLFWYLERLFDENIKTKISSSLNKCSSEAYLDRYFKAVFDKFNV